MRNLLPFINSADFETDKFFDINFSNGHRTVDEKNFRNSKKYFLLAYDVTTFESRKSK